MAVMAYAACGFAATPREAASGDPIKARTITFSKSNAVLGEAALELSKQSGIPIAVDPKVLKAACPVNYDKVPFWSALDDLAAKTNTRIVLRDSGKSVSLEPRGKSVSRSFVSGPFRTLGRQAVAKFDLELGAPSYVVQLDAHWEPRFPVFRISSAPQVTKATDDRGTALTASSAKTSTQVTGFAHSFDVVRLDGLTRESKSIAFLQGFYTVTAAEQMLAFRFEDMTAKLPAAPPAQAGVIASLKRVEKDDNVWEFEVEVSYPAGLPHFESFEEGVWLARNRMQLIPPGGGKAFAPDDHQFLQIGQRVVAVYRFKENAEKGLTNPKSKGWSVIYESPSPLLEFRVLFELKDIPLP
jgi:hypothetical protein